jgi:hypothetical protein
MTIKPAKPKSTVVAYDWRNAAYYIGLGYQVHTMAGVSTYVLVKY